MFHQFSIRDQDAGIGFLGSTKKWPTPSISNKHRKLIYRARYIKERTGSRQPEAETAHSVVDCAVNF